MEIVDVFMQLINQAGFPIATCVILMLYVKKQQEDNKELMTGFMSTLSEYNKKLDMLTEKINRLFEKEA